tara:strand:- start:267 stop:4826 length:4560 start_codon:yes stop_codon:yes gene_type:complete
MGCKYYSDGKENQLYTDLYGYLDNVDPNKRSGARIYKILKKHGIATKIGDNIYLNQSNLPYSKRELVRIEGRYPGLLETKFIKNTPESYYSRASELHTLSINEITLKTQIPADFESNSDFDYNTEYELESYLNAVATPQDRADLKMSEQIRKENTSEQREKPDEPIGASRFNRTNEYMYNLPDYTGYAYYDKKAKTFQDMFAKHGIKVDFIVDHTMSGLGQVDPTALGETPTVRINTTAAEDTIPHEFAHIYLDLLGLDNPAVKSALIDIKRETGRYALVKRHVDQYYPDYNGDMYDKELLATAMGLEYLRQEKTATSDAENLLNPTPKVDENPGWFQEIINEIKKFWIDFLKGFSGEGNIYNANIEALTREMFTGNLQSENFIGEFNPALQESRDQDKITKLVNQQKVRVENQIRAVNQLPLEKREKELATLEKLKASLKRINKIEDLNQFVTTLGNSLASSKRKYDKIMKIPITKRATNDNLNEIWSLKGELDGINTIKSIKDIMRVKKAKLKANEALPTVRFDTMEERVVSILEQFEIINSDFQDNIIPILAEKLLPLHNKNINTGIDDFIQNFEEGKKKGIYRYTGIDPSPEFSALKEKRNLKEISELEFQKARTDIAIEQLKNKKITNRGDLIREMRAAHKDKSGYSYLFDPIIYSSEPIIQLFAKSISNQNIEANDATLSFKGEMSSEYNSWAKDKNDFNVSELNEPIVEEVIIESYNHKLKKNERKTVLSFVNPIDQNKFYTNKLNFERKTAEEFSKPERKDYQDETVFQEAQKKWYLGAKGRAFIKKTQAWLKENTEPLDGWKAIRDSIQSKIWDAKAEKGKAANAEIAEEYENKITQLRKILSNNMLNNVPRNEWVKPKKSKYTNPKYTAIQSNPVTKKYYDFVIKSMQESHAMIGANRMHKNKWDNYSYLMPSYRKDIIARGQEQGSLLTGKDLLKESVTITETNQDNGIYHDLSGELVKQVPVYATNVVESKDISMDVASSVYRFRHMANKYKAKSKIVGEVNLFRLVMENRGTLEVTSSGMEQVDKVAKQLGIKLPVLKKGDSYTFKHINEWIDVVMFGQEELKQEFNLFGKNISATQMAGSINQFVAVNNLSFNLLQGANQYVMDNMSLLQEAVAGQFMSTKDLAWAKSQYWAQGAMKDIGEFMPITKLGKAMEFFDALTEITDREGNRVVGNKAKRLLDSGGLMFLQQGVEHQLSATRMLGLMKSLEGKLKDKNGNVIQRNGKDANLFDLLVIDEKGRMSVDPEVSEDSFNKNDFTHLLRGLGRRTNQIKGKFDAPILQRTWYGKMIGLFRSWVSPGIRRRYGHGGFTGSTIHMDEELGTLTQGYYISFANMVTESFQRNKGDVFKTYGEMTELERQNIKRTLTELSALVATSALIFYLGSKDDDERGWAANFILYQATRYQMEIKQWTPVVGTKEAFRILKSPTATARPIEDGISILEQILYQELPYLVGIGDEADIFYQRDTGRYSKGDRKIRKKVEDLIPAWRGITRSSNPEEAQKWFNSIK